MSKIKVLTVFGTRPEAIKMAPLVKELEKYPETFESIVCVTAQHRQMLDQVLNLFNIKPDFVLNLGTAGSVKHSVGDILVCCNFLDRDLVKINHPEITSKLELDKKNISDFSRKCQLIIIMNAEPAILLCCNLRI